MDADYGKGMIGPDHAQQIQELAQRLDRLLEAMARLAAENRELNRQLLELGTERDRLLGKNAQARGRVEAMLGRLDLLERSDD